jgi:uncharacterized protein (UPF0218 family)
MIVPEEVKPRLRATFGKLCSSPSDVARFLSSVPGKGKVITIGDAVSYNIISAGINPDIIVYDGLEGREKVKSWMKNFVEAYIADQKSVKNPAGHITAELWQVAFEALRSKGKTKIFVQGEEDLAFIPFVILCSVGDCILYGVPRMGIDVVVVEENVKNTFRRLLKEFQEDEEAERKKAKNLKEERIKEMFRGRRR